MWIVTVIFTVFLIFLFDFLYIDKRSLELFKKFKGQIRLPIIGTYLCCFNVAALETPTKIIDELFEKYSKKNPLSFFSSWMGYQSEIFTDDIRLISTILQSPKFLTKGLGYNTLKEQFGDGLFITANKSKWAVRRRMITPAFHFKILEQFFDVFKEQNCKLMKKISEKSEQGYFNVIPLVTESTINSLCATAMGCEGLDFENKDYISSASKVLKLVMDRFVSPQYYIPFYYYFSPLKKEIDYHTNILKSFTTKVIEQRRVKLENEIKNKEDKVENVQKEDDSGSNKKKDCLLDLLLQSTVNGLPLSNEDISEEVENFMFAGQDTTTNAISLTLYLLAKYPEVQQKLVNEIEEVLGDGEFTYNILNEFKYLEMVIKETLRIHPPVPVIARMPLEEIEIEGCTFPAKTNFNLVFYRMFKNPEIFKNPEDFIPERFEDSNHYPLSFIPFSAGQRNCIGQRYAMNNIRLNLVNIIRKFKVSYKNEPKIMYGFTTKCDAINLSFEARK